MTKKRGPARVGETAAETEKNDAIDETVRRKRSAEVAVEVTIGTKDEERRAPVSCATSQSSL